MKAIDAYNKACDKYSFKAILGLIEHAAYNGHFQVKLMTVLTDIKGFEETAQKLENEGYLIRFDFNSTIISWVKQEEPLVDDIDHDYLLDKIKESEETLVEDKYKGVDWLASVIKKDEELFKEALNKMSGGLQLPPINPCPFCGQIGSIIEFDFLGERNETLYDIGCGTEGCYREHRLGLSLPTKLGIISVWNKRS